MSDDWQAVALSREVDRKPVRVKLDSAPLVLFRSGEGLAAMTDRCPHRLAELSKGRVIGGEIECPYHGWRFGGDGQCRAIPGHLGDMPRYRVKTYRVTECEGVIFVSAGAPVDPPYTHAMAGQNVIVRRVRSSTQSTLIDVAENILDATHTHYTHKGLLRGLSSKRQVVDVAVQGGAGWVEAVYTGEDKQQGAVSKLLEGQRMKTIGRYRHPGIAELEYWGPKGLALSTTFHLRQVDARRVEGVGFLVGPRGGLLDYLKTLAFRPMFKLALEQDRRVLRSASDNAALAPDARAVVGPVDFLRDDIAAIIAGRLPAPPSTHQIAL